MIKRSERLNNVSYDLCGPLYERAKELEVLGHKIIKLNIGNPAPFGFDAPTAVTEQIIRSLSQAQGYSDHKGLLSAREAIKRYYTAKDIKNIHTEDICLGNGVSELIMQAVQALLNDGDEVLVPSPDYPLWTAAVRFAGGKAVHYRCDEEADWYPDLNDIKSKINSRTRAIVIINPNNPTGAVYSQELLQELVKLAEEHNLVLFSDEIYDKILYDNTIYTSTATLSEEVLCVTFGGLSKNYLAAGFRAGWMLVSGAKHKAKAYLDGLNTMASLRVCSNVPAQFAIETALEGEQTILDLTLPTGRLGQQRAITYEKLTAIPGITCVKPMGAFYMFPKLDVKKFNIESDQHFALDLLIEQHVLLVPGTGFNFQQYDHFRVVYLPEPTELSNTLDRLTNFLKTYQQQF
ncbi:pyridoxal phosphate-dependent aminotransferase [Pontibacter cellulosilyticus]|uniref:Aminotransferase n=1 Tax=Pontibacter cellulosilyticus TaxID=1720253 RepID=A0A923SHG0_9BACT|nr:pyridoxal phosphate-dependent aminotransferase [Pontibacter cellulosilyticus]MBC5991507.1 pyridoxal phosphate-dependent aminotransferase [Pontibacter cellulosilyticus]